MNRSMRATVGEWWNSISLRAKITGVTVLVLTLGLIVSGFGVMTVLRNYLITDADRQLQQTLKNSGVILHERELNIGKL